MPLKSMRVEVWSHGLLQCLSVRSPGRRHRTPGPLLCKGRQFTASCRALITGITQLPAPNVFLNICEPAGEWMYTVPVASLHLTGKD